MRTLRASGHSKAGYCHHFGVIPPSAEVTLCAWADNPDAVAFYRPLGMRVQKYVFEDIL